MGPHPAVAEVRRAVRAALTGPALVACSGGADSLALAAAVAFEAPRARVTAGLVTVDHGLQPGSDIQAKAVADLGYELGFDPVEIVQVDVRRPGGPEAAARTARYGALDAVAEALDMNVLLGHTLDDQAETVLLGLGRGSGPRSIAGMRPVEGRYRRPLLGVRRATTQAVCLALGVEPWDDPHNADPAYQRVRLRHEVMPLLEDVLQGGVAAALARTAALVRDDVDALDELAAQQVAPELSVGDLETLPQAIRTRVLRAWAHRCGTAPLTTTHIAALDALITDWHGQGPIDLPGGFEAVRASGRLDVRAKQPDARANQLDARAKQLAMRAKQRG
jgi:tRNA(Ile)-lysidine synthase